MGRPETIMACRISVFLSLLSSECSSDAPIHGIFTWFDSGLTCCSCWWRAAVGLRKAGLSCTSNPPTTLQDAASTIKKRPFTRPLIGVQEHRRAHAELIFSMSRDFRRVQLSFHASQHTQLVSPAQETPSTQGSHILVQRVHVVPWAPVDRTLLSCV